MAAKKKVSMQQQAAPEPTPPDQLEGYGAGEPADAGSTTPRSEPPTYPDDYELVGTPEEPEEPEEEG